MKPYLLLLPLLLSLTVAAQTPIANSEPSSKRVTIYLKDGSLYTGTITQRDSVRLIIQRRGSDFSVIPLNEIDRIEPGKPRRPATLKAAGDSTSGMRPARGRVVLKDGTTYTGTIEQRDSTRLLLRRGKNETSVILQEEIQSVVLKEPTAEKPPSANLFAPWHLFSPTAFNPERGRFYLLAQTTVPNFALNQSIISSEIHYGITSFWSVGVSTAPIRLGISRLPPQINFKTRLSGALGPKVRLGIQANYVTIQRENPVTDRGLLSFTGLLTIGTPENNLSVNYRVQRFRFFGEALTMSMAGIGFVKRLSQQVSLLSDNVIFFNSDNFGPRINTGLLSVATRLNRRRHAFDLGLNAYFFLPGGIRIRSNFYLSPYAAYNLRFGGKK